MGDALRRLLWLFPVLGAGAIFIFFVLGSTSTVSRTLSHPLFYNDSPASAQVEATLAVEAALRGDATGARRLEELGGAALPVVLERMKTVSVAEQRKLAAALTLLAERIRRATRSSYGQIERLGTDRATETDALDRELLFWERYRDEHALDLRPQATSRLVRRMSGRDAERKSTDLVAVDTYALPHLVAALGRISSVGDVRRARRVIEAISTLTRKNWELSADATVGEARDVASEIRRFWDENGGQWTQMDPLQLLAARASQTEFWTWIFRSGRELSGLDSPALTGRMLSKGRGSSALFLACLIGLLVLGPAVAATVEVIQLRQSRFQFERVGFRAVSAWLLTLTATWLVTREGTGWTELLLLGALVGTTSAAFILHRELSDRVDWRTHHVLRDRPRLSRVGAVVRWLAPSIPALVPIAIAEAALFVTCLEASARFEGLGLEALRALQKGDLDFLMALCLGLGFATGSTQILADLFLGNVKSRLGDA